MHSLMLDGLLHWACPKRSVKKYFSFHARLKAPMLDVNFPLLIEEVADMMTDITRDTGIKKLPYFSQANKMTSRAESQG